MQLEVGSKATSAIEQLGDVTGRDALTVVKDALKTYKWILEQQAAGREVGTRQAKLQNFVVNRRAAKQYVSSRTAPKPT
jgi:hypothetical protein